MTDRKKLAWDEVIITDETDGIMTAWCKDEDGWWQVKANETEVLSIIQSPFKEGLPFFITTPASCQIAPPKN